jgi:hypothetical protein
MTREEILKLREEFTALSGFKVSTHSLTTTENEDGSGYGYLTFSIPGGGDTMESMHACHVAAREIYLKHHIHIETNPWCTQDE